MDYQDQYKLPEWQKKRLEIFNRDGWQCVCCFSKEDMLSVHHKYYKKDKKVWEYKDDCYITLCQYCHDCLHGSIKEYPEYYKHRAKTMNLTQTDIFLFNSRLHLFIKAEGPQGLNTILQLLNSYLIKIDEI